MNVATRRRQERRLARIQALSLAASCGSAVFFGAFFVARVPMLTAGAAAVAVALVPAELMLWFWRNHPPSIEPRSETEEEEPPTSDTYGWEVGTFLIAVVVVPLIVLVGLVLRFFVPLAIIVGFWIASDDASLVSVLVATGCCLAVLACVEFGVEIPLSRRWGLPLDTKTRPLEDYCPTPNSRKHHE